MRMTFAERHAWKVFVGISVIIVLFGVGDVISGGSTYREGETVLFKSLSGTTWDALRSTDPGAAKLIDSQVRSNGAVLFIVGLLSLSISATALRRGERWAWLTMWVLPLWFLLIYLLFWIAQPDLRSGLPVPLISGSIFLVLSVATLVLSHRRFLRKT